jgi:hypothetical protein
LLLLLAAICLLLPATSTCCYLQLPAASTCFCLRLLSAASTCPNIAVTSSAAQSTLRWRALESE